MPDSKHVWTALVLAGACLAMAPTPAHASQPSAPAPHIDENLSLTGTVVWEGLHTRRVVLSLANGAELRGTVVAQDATSLAIARASDGSVVSVPKREIAGVRVANVSELGRATPTSPRPHLRDSGRSDYVAGAVLLGLGVPIGVSGTAMLGVCVSCFYIHLPLLLPGIGLMIAGSRLMKRGTAKNKAFRGDWGIPMAARMQLAPSLSLGRGGGELGFTIRF